MREKTAAVESKEINVRRSVSILIPIPIPISISISISTDHLRGQLHRGMGMDRSLHGSWSIAMHN